MRENLPRTCKQKINNAYAHTHIYCKEIVIRTKSSFRGWPHSMINLRVGKFDFTLGRFLIEIFNQGSLSPSHTLSHSLSLSLLFSQGKGKKSGSLKFTKSMMTTQ